jgi:hypothetical protein
MSSTVIDRESTTAVLGVDFREAFPAEADCSQEYGSFIQNQRPRGCAKFLKEQERLRVVRMGNTLRSYV